MIPGAWLRFGSRLEWLTHLRTHYVARVEEEKFVRGQKAFGLYDRKHILFERGQRRDTNHALRCRTQRGGLAAASWWSFSRCHRPTGRCAICAGRKTRPARMRAGQNAWRRSRRRESVRRAAQRGGLCEGRLRDFHRPRRTRLSTLRTSCTEAEDTAKIWPLTRNRMICSVRTGCGFAAAREAHQRTPTGAGGRCPSTRFSMAA